MAMQLTQFLHAAIVVSDLEKSEQFYEIVLGLKKIDRVLKFPGAWYEIGAFQIHLIADSAPVSELQQAEKWGRNRHLAFCVTSIEAAKATLIQAGCDFQVSASGRAALFVKDPDGNIVELGEA
ncbi:MAG: VOC family protein [Leptolyngbya sp. Prado105]|jgi:catechol 2,3-dioxygenase-like lactoylglutathione lyase family enzyme|nr:VOC family protein [Leptolyngbya sp. Prado105]